MPSSIVQLISTNLNVFCPIDGFGTVYMPVSAAVVVEYLLWWAPVLSDSQGSVQIEEGYS